MAPGMVSADVEVKRVRGRPPKVKGMVSPAPLTPDCIPKASSFTPPTPSCTAPLSERVMPRRLFGAEEKKAEPVTPTKSTPKKAKAKDRGFEEEDAVPETRKSPRLTRSASKSVSETPKRGRGRPRKIFGSEAHVEKKLGHRGSRRNPTRRTGESLSEGQVRRHVKKIVFEGVEYRVGDDVYVRRGAKADNANGNAEQWSDSDAEVEDCVLCGRSGDHVMIECDEWLGGYHLRCLEPPLDEVPEGDWMCAPCTAMARGENVSLHSPSLLCNRLLSNFHVKLYVVRI
jgi:origin recognition complex subunit 1